MTLLQRNLWRRLNQKEISFSSNRSIVVSRQNQTSKFRSPKTRIFRSFRFVSYNLRNSFCHKCKIFVMYGFSFNETVGCKLSCNF